MMAIERTDMVITAYRDHVQAMIQIFAKPAIGHHQDRMASRLKLSHQLAVTPLAEKALADLPDRDQVRLKADTTYKSKWLSRASGPARASACGREPRT